MKAGSFCPDKPFSFSSLTFLSDGGLSSTSPAAGEYWAIRKPFLDKVRKKADEIEKLKVKRDEQNKIARGTTELLEKINDDILGTLIDKDIPLAREINLFENALEKPGGLCNQQIREIRYSFYR